MKEALLRAFVWYKANEKKIRKYSRILGLMFFVAGVVLMATSVASAQTATTESGTALYNTLLKLVKGGVGKSVAIIGFLVGGIAMFMGNFTLGLMMLIGAGFIALAPTLIEAIFSTQ